MIEAGIPRRARESVPVVRDENGVLAVVGMGQSERASAKKGEPFYMVSFHKLPEEDTE